jgi:predicted ATPase
MASLSDRELDVLQALSDGLSNEGVAARLFISVKTVEATCRSIFRKLDLLEGDATENRRVKAVVRYLLEGPAQASLIVEPPTEFIGRQTELADLERTLGSARLLTISGPGGIGKTRLALAVAHRWRQDNRPVCFIDLTGATDEAGLLGATALAIGNPNLTLSAAGRRLSRAVGGEGLVIFDNADTVVAPAQRWVEEITTSEGLTVLVTSRTPLGASGEVVWPVPALSLADATSLLRSRSNASLSPAEAEELCASVGGHPLAIELIAGRLDALPLSQMLARSKEMARLLGDGPGDGRQHLGRVLDASLADVGPVCTLALQRLSVFPGGFDFDAAQALVGEPGVAIVLPQLVDAALVAFDGAHRYRMLEPVRQHAHGRLLDGPHRDGLDRAVTAWGLALVRSVRPDGSAERGGLAREMADRTALERTNIEVAVRAALRIGQTEAALEIVDGLGLHWAMTSAHSAQPLVDEVLAHVEGGEDEHLVAGAILAAGMVAVRAHDPRCIDYLRDAHERFVAAGHHRDAIFTEYWLLRGSFGLIGSFDESLNRARDLGDQRLIGYLLEGKARHAYLNGEPIADLLPWLVESEQIGRATDPELAGLALISIANRRLDLDRLGAGQLELAEVKPLAEEAAQIAATATTSFDLCEVLLLDLRIEHRFGSPATARAAALGVLQATVARDGTVAAAVAMLYAADLVLRSAPRVSAEQATTATEAQRIAACYANDRPGGRSRILVDNFPSLVDESDPSIDDEAVLRAALSLIEVLEPDQPRADPSR